MGDWEVVAMNVRGEACVVEAELPEFVKCDGLEMVVASTGGVVAQCLGEGRMQITLPAYGYAIVSK
jgi:hypothetical protein